MKEPLKVEWEEIGIVVHKVKGILTKVVGIELMCKKLREEAQEELDKLNEIMARDD